MGVEYTNWQDFLLEFGGAFAVFVSALLYVIYRQRKSQNRQRKPNSR